MSISVFHTSVFSSGIQNNEPDWFLGVFAIQNMMWNVPFAALIILKLSSTILLQFLCLNKLKAKRHFAQNKLSFTIAPRNLECSMSRSWMRCEGAWWEMKAFLPAAVLEHRSIVKFPRALIREPPLRKHTCRQPMRHCPATHTGPAYTRTNANTLANRAKTHTHLQSCERGLLGVWPLGANLVC